MIVPEVVAVAIVCALMVITTNPRQSRPDRSRVHTTTRTTRAAMALVQFLALICVGLAIPANAFGVGLIRASVWLNITGVVLMTFGLLVRIYSMRILGSHYSSILFVNEGQPLITRGIYGVIRHPIYLGDLILFVAAGGAVGNYIVLSVVSVTAVSAYIVRIHHEERMMIDSYGDAYVAYRKGTRRLIPFVY